MPDPKILLLAALLALTVAFVLFWIAQERRRSHQGRRLTLPHTVVGFVTDFLDTLGIGSFAVTTSIYRLWRMVPDQHIPGTLNVGHALPTVVQALIYITIVAVGFETLAVLILSAVGGSWIGASIVAGLPKRGIQRGMGVALVVAAVLMTLTALDRLPGGGEALSLTGNKLVLACGINFVLGALMTLGIGAYAPIMIMVSLLGMNPTAAFPIMMGSCAFLMPTASAQFIRKQKYDVRAALGLTTGGIPGVIIAAFIFTTLPVVAVRWLVVVVVVYTAITLLRAAATEPEDASSLEPLAKALPRG
ncbi:MAG TPA: sulfite exporter TauE/SafE family protein [Vicinamibacterales bacterium]|nr:sulfite exporter TauE/SafE family protein [Vicinamibacterales bacterium]